MQVQLNETQISDLFFNSERPHYTGYFNTVTDASHESAECREALTQDAQFFSDMTGNQVSAEWLVEDFFRRV